MPTHALTTHQRQRKATPELRALRQRLANTEAILDQRTAQLYQVLQEANTDSLTGIANRRRLHEALEKAAYNYQRYGHTATIVVFDLNGFKPINDTFGHAAGDATLQHIAALLVQHTRKTDIVARTGGDEFVVLLQSTTQAQAALKTNQLCHTIANTPLRWVQTRLKIQASAGWASLAEASTAAALLQLADDRMYAAKLKGKLAHIR